MLIKRIATAAVLAPLVVIGTLKLDNFYFGIALASVVTIGAWEYSRLIQIQQKMLQVLYGVVIAVIALLGASFEVYLMPLLMLSAAWWLLNIVWILSYPKYSSCWHTSWPARLINGLFIFVPMVTALVTLQQNTSELVLLLLVLIWSADSGAFFVGKSIGRHKLSPKVSPGKTIEGAIGGIVATIGVMMIYVALQIDGAVAGDYFQYAVVALLVAIASIVGDLFESLYKRISNIKDSGNLLPGHGGVFDRVDSLTAAAPIFYLAYELLI